MRPAGTPRPAGTSRSPQVAPVSLAVVAVVTLVALALAAWEGTIVQSSASAHWSALAVMAVALAGAVLAGRGRQRSPSAAWVRRGARTVRRDLLGPGRRPAPLVAATAAWVVLAAATVGWDLNSFVHQAPYLPTLSRLVGEVTHHEWGRAAVFAAWLALGTYLAVGGRTPRSDGAAGGSGGGGSAAP